MINRYSNPGPDEWPELAKRPVRNFRELEKPVRSILKKVREEGDKAVRKFGKEFDGVLVKKLEVS